MSPNDTEEQRDETGDREDDTTDDHTTMSDNPSERVSELLASVQELFEDASEDDSTLEELTDFDEPEQSPLFEHAENARELIETNEPETVLEALDLSELPDGSEPSSIPDAIARAPEDRVWELHALVTLAGLADQLEEFDQSDERSTSELEEEVADLEQTLSVESGSDSVSMSPSDGSETESESGLESIRRAVSDSSPVEFRDGLETLQTQLEDIREDDSETVDSETDRQSDEAETTDSETDGQSDEAETDDSESDSLVEFDDGPSSDRSQVHSTLPSSNRPDMNAVARYSLVSNRNRGR